MRPSHPPDDPDFRNPNLRSFIIVAFVLACFGSGAGADEEPGEPNPIRSAPSSLAAPDPTPAPRSAAEGGAAATAELSLSERQVRLGGIETAAARRFSLLPEFAVHGLVVDIGPLLSLRARYRAAQAELGVAEAALSLSRKNRDRLQALGREAIIATKDLVQAESVLAADRTRVLALRQALRQIREEGLQAWGPEMFEQAIAGHAPLWEQVLRLERVLLLIALPAETSLPAAARRILVARNRDRLHAIEAELIGPAKSTDTLVQGETYYFSAVAGNFRTGMRIDAWIPVAGEQREGVFVPDSAILWYGGRPWVYQRTAPDRFVRRPLRDYSEYGAGWFVGEGFHGGESLVVAGAELLLAEEMRRQIPEEDD